MQNKCAIFALDMKNMSRKHNIAFVVVSVLVLLIAPFIPHHHHEGVACVVMERCEDDDTYNDEHTDHNESSEDSHSNTSCVEDAQFLASKSGQSYKASVENFNPALLVSFIISQYNSLLPTDVDVRGALMYGDYIITYKSAEIITSNGLRGPPSCIA